EPVADPAAIALAHSLLGIAFHLIGDLSGARVELEAALRGPRAQHTGTIHLGFDHHDWAGIALARTLWLQGLPVQAVACARRTVENAASKGHPVTLSGTLNRAISVFLWTGDLQSAERHLDWFISHAESHGLLPWLTVGRGIKGQLTLRRGDTEEGVRNLRGCLKELHATRYELLTTEFNIALAQGLATIGRLAEGMTLIDETIRLVEANGDLVYLPELLRVKGGLILSMPQPSTDDAEMCFAQSLELSRRQGARAWELRTAVDLAA